MGASVFSDLSHHTEQAMKLLPLSFALLIGSLLASEEAPRDEDLDLENPTTLTRFSFGLGKRSSEKSILPCICTYPSQSHEGEIPEEVLGPFGPGKRSYAFGLGKRDHQYGFGLGKRDQQQFGFGLGKRAGQYGFGLGKRAGQYGFGLGKRNYRDALYEFGLLGKRDQQQYGFGLGKRD